MSKGIRALVLVSGFGWLGVTAVAQARHHRPTRNHPQTAADSAGTDGVDHDDCDTRCERGGYNDDDGVKEAARDLPRPMQRPNQGGRIVNLSSIAADGGTRGASIYAASKAAIVGK